MKNIKNWIENEATDSELIDIVKEIFYQNGALEEYAFYYMEELDDIFYNVRPTELLSKLANDFDVNDEGFRETIWGLESCSMHDVAEEIKNNVEEVAEQIVQAMQEADLYLPDSLQEILK